MDKGQEIVDASEDSDFKDEESLLRNEAKKSRRVAIAGFIALTFMFLASLFYTPSPVDANGRYFTVCGFKALTGLPCPGCGLTHSFCAIGKGDLGEAFAFNAVGPPLFAVSILVWLRFLFTLTGVKRPVELFDRRVNHTMLIRLFAIALGLFGVARIVYMVIWPPPGVQDSPLVRLMHKLLV